jgi:hypothetical protein
MDLPQIYNQDGIDIFLNLHRLAFAERRLEKMDKIKAAPYLLDLLRRKIYDNFKIQNDNSDIAFGIEMLMDMKLMDENLEVPEQVASIFRDSIEVSRSADYFAPNKNVYVCNFRPGHVNRPMSA